MRGRSPFRITVFALLHISTATLQAEGFSFDTLREHARELAAAPYVESDRELDDYWKNLGYDQHRDIRFKVDAGLWAEYQGPFSSMYWFGGGTHPKPHDFRPEVHDNDGLLMELESGHPHYRPLEHADARFRHCVFTMNKPRSWALLQRDRSFSSYQDIETRYHDRPSVRVEPLQGFDHGKLHLIEMPTIDETNDNVILVWEPEPPLEVGRPFRFHYRLRWMHDPAASGLFTVRATRSGTPVQKPDQILMAIDFAKPLRPIEKTGDPK